MMIRDAPKVNSLAAMEKFIRYNNYTSDEISAGNPGDAISSRLDLLEVYNNYIKLVKSKSTWFNWW